MGDSSLGIMDFAANDDYVVLSRCLESCRISKVGVPLSQTPTLQLWSRDRVHLIWERKTTEICNNLILSRSAVIVSCFDWAAQITKFDLLTGSPLKQFEPMQAAAFPPAGRAPACAK